MKHRPKKVRHIAVVLWTGTASGRDLLAGVLQYAQGHKDWSISLIQLPGESASHLKAIISLGVDGIITGDMRNEAVLRLIRETDAPVVTVDDLTPDQSGNCRFERISDHNSRIGELGARHFLSVGKFNSYGFVSDIVFHRKIPDSAPEMRANAFRKAIADTGADCRRFFGLRDQDTEVGIRRLHDWLKELPKPAAVMCFYDNLALHVIHACNQLGLTVPTQVSVLGVDNDVLLCESATPPLSSIDPDHHAIGYQMARHLDALLHGRRLKDKAKPYSIDRVIVRESTRNTVPAATLVRRAMDFISEHATEGIGVDDVVRHLGVSRRLVFLRLQQIEGRTIRDIIEETRINLAAKRLRETNWTVARIARSCGYEHLQTFGTAFRRRFKMSPRQFRGRE